ALTTAPALTPSSLVESSQAMLVMTETEELTDLRERKQLLDEVLGSVPVLVIRASADGVVTNAEGDGLRRWGLDAGELVGVSLLDRHPAGSHVGAGVRRALSGERASGTAHYANDATVEYHVVPRRDEAGRVCGLNGL